MVNYWDRLKPEMDARKMSRRGLATALGISYQAVKKVADGGSLGSENNLKAAKLFGLNPEWLATEKGPKQRASTSDEGLNVSDQFTILTTGQNPITFEQALDTLVKTVQTTDDLTRDQIKPLINRMFDEPGRAAEIAARISAAVSSGSAGTPNTTTTTKVGNEEMPSFLKR